MQRRAPRGTRPDAPAEAARQLRLVSDEGGSVSVEYAMLLGLVSVGASIALIGLGALLLALFRYQQLILLLPFS